MDKTGYVEWMRLADLVALYEVPVWLVDDCVLEVRFLGTRSVNGGDLVSFQDNHRIRHVLMV